MQTEFKNRQSDEFVASSTWNPALSASDLSVDGAFVRGAKSSFSTLTLKGWYYEFLAISSMVGLKTVEHVNDFLQLQYLY